MNKNSKAVNRLKDREDRPEKRMKPKHLRLIILSAILIGAAGVTGGIGYHVMRITAEAQERRTFGDDVVAKLDGDEVKVDTFMLYSIDIKNGYEKQYGSNIWSQPKKNAYNKTETYEKVAKEDILEQIRFVWALGKEGRKRGIKLTASENKALGQTAQAYYKSLKEAGVRKTVVPYNDVLQYYKENYYAQKVYYSITKTNSVDTASGDAKAEMGTDTTNSTEKAQELWKKIVNKYYPDFDYDIDINWNLLDQIKFSDSASGDASAH